MKQFFILAAIAAQVGVLGWMAGEREWVLRTGESVYLRTAPVDPQDPMRGDYVRLTYEGATIRKSLCRDAILEWFGKQESIYNANVRDRRVYATIQRDDDGVAVVTSLSDQRPKAGVFIRGRAEAIHLSTIEVRFGTEAFFMQQGKAREFENDVRTKKAGVPLNMELAVAPNGLAVLKGYRWEPLGITVTVDRNPAPAPNAAGGTQRNPGLRGATVELKNHGTTPQAIVVGSGGANLRLIPANDRERTNEPVGWVWVGERLPPVKPVASHVKVLQSGESHREHLDFTAAEWLVQKSDASGLGPPVAMEKAADDWSASFRVQYLPPSVAACAELPQANLIRHAELRSRRFSASGGFD